MTFTEITSLLGGLALFLFGMKMMSDGLEQAAGDKMKKILEHLTSNRLLGVAVGAGITAVIQSSSATTVMVVGFVNSRLLTLRQAIWIIMGANIGTTVTGQLIALDIGTIAPILAIIGVVFVVFLKSKKMYNIGHIIGGLGILFIGMAMMSDSMYGLRDSTVFTGFIQNFKNPFLGILAGAVFTAVIQSSSASVGILQALAASGTITLSSSVYVLFGQNIGTCITAVLASIGTGRNAKRTTIIHLMFNVIGTAVFVIICSIFPLTDFIEMLTPDKPAQQIANVHTIFNIVTTAILLPFGSLLEKTAKKILPEKESELCEVMQLNFIPPSSLKNHTIGSASVAISQVRSEIDRMYKLAISNVSLAFDSILENKTSNQNDILRNEEYIDFLNAEITKYLSLIFSSELTEHDAKTFSSFFQISTNIERISDHAVNISEYALTLKGKPTSITESAYNEIEEMKCTSVQGLESICIISPKNPRSTLYSIKDIEKRIDALTEMYRRNQLDRLKSNQCSGDISVIYSEMITDFERIGDHMLNIAELMSDEAK